MDQNTDYSYKRILGYTTLIHLKVNSNAVILGLFSDLMKFTVVNESLSINKPNVLYWELFTILMYYQQNEKSTGINQEGNYKVIGANCLALWSSVSTVMSKQIK